MVVSHKEILLTRPITRSVMATLSDDGFSIAHRDSKTANDDAAWSFRTRSLVDKAHHAERDGYFER
jgi:hypothetical protein